MRLALLADHPRAAKQVAQWYFDEWARADPGMTFERVLERVLSFVDRQTAPMLVLAMEGGEPIGAAELKIREMDIYPDFEFWVGGVYVARGSRGRGVAAALVREVMARARAAGIERLHLQTEDLTGGLYTRLGFEPLEQVTYKGYHALVMAADLGA